MKKQSFVMISALLAAVVVSGFSCTALDGTSSAQLGSAQMQPASQLVAAYVDMIDALLPGMGHKKLVERQESQLTFEKICFQASGPRRETRRNALCKAIMMRVGPEIAKPARVWLLRKIEPIGRREVVAGLTTLLHDEDAQIRELARRALQNNPSSKATAVLRAELSAAKCCKRQVAMINALAFRRDIASTDAFAELAHSDNDSVASAAIAALGKLGNRKSVKTLLALRKIFRPTLRNEITDACMRAAEHLLEAGNKREAARIYDSIFSASELENIRIAALHGLVSTCGADCLPLLMKLITGNDERMQIVALRCAQDIPGKEVTLRLIVALDDAGPDLQILLLDVLGQRGDKTARPKVVDMLQRSDRDVRMAALKALKHLGDSSTALLLAEWVTKTTDEERDTARESLALMPGVDVDKVILSEMAGASVPVRVELIKAAAARRITEAKALLYAAAEDREELVQLAALDALDTLGAEDDLSKLLGLLVKAKTDSTRQASEKAVMTVCQRIDDKQQQTDPVIAALDQANALAQAAMIRVLGTIESDEALKAVVKHCKAKDKVVKGAAIGVLAKWSTSDALDGLFDVIKTEDDQTNRELALRGYVRLVVGMSGENQVGSIAALERVRKSIPNSATQDKANQALDTLKRYCVTWRYCGPYKAKDKGQDNLIDVVFAPENPEEEAKEKWRPLSVTNLEQPSKLAFSKLIDERHCCAYAKTAVWSTKEQEALLTLGSDDGIKAWLNGNVVHTNDVKREVLCDEDKVTITLKQGWNPLLLKVTQRSDSFGFCCAVKAPDGSLLEGLKFEAK